MTQKNMTYDNPKAVKNASLYSSYVSSYGKTTTTINNFFIWIKENIHISYPKITSNTNTNIFRFTANLNTPLKMQRCDKWLKLQLNSLYCKIVCPLRLSWRQFNMKSVKSIQSSHTVNVQFQYISIRHYQHILMITIYRDTIFEKWLLNLIEW